MKKNEPQRNATHLLSHHHKHNEEYSQRENKENGAEKCLKKLWLKFPKFDEYY